MRSTPNFAAVLATGLALAMGLRLYHLGAQDFWLDEIYTMSYAAGRRAAMEALPHGVVLSGLQLFDEPVEETGWSGVWRDAAHDSHPPLYFLFYRCWRSIAGDGEFAARLPAAVFSVLSMIPLALIMRLYGKPQAGAWLVVGLAVAYAHIRMGQECRPYSLSMLLVGISYWSVLRLHAAWETRNGLTRTAWLLVYGLATYLAVMTHYFAVVALAGQVVVAVLYFRGAVRWVWIGTLLVAILLFAVTWGAQLRAQYTYTASHTWLLEDDPDHLWRTFLRFADLPYRLLFMHEPFRLSVLRSCLCLAVLAAVLVLLWRRRRSEAIVFAAWYFVGAAMLASIDVFAGRQTLSHVRYVSVLVPGLVGMIVPVVLGFSHTGRLLSAAAVAVAVALTLSLPTQDNPHNRTAARLIARRTAPDTLLVFDAIGWPPFWVSQIYHDVAYYLAREPDWTDGPVVLLRDEPDDVLREKIAGFERLVVVSPRVDAVPNPVPARFRTVERTDYVYQIGFIYVFENRHH